MRALLLALALCTGCLATVQPPAPEPAPDPLPQPPPVPEPVPAPQPAPGPAATPCERAFARSVEIGCGYDAEGFGLACQAFADLDGAGGDAGWDLDCMGRSTSCAELERCRETGAP